VLYKGSFITELRGFISFQILQTLEEAFWEREVKPKLTREKGSSREKNLQVEERLFGYLRFNNIIEEEEKPKETKISDSGLDGHDVNNSGVKRVVKSPLKKNVNAGSDIWGVQANEKVHSQDHGINSVTTANKWVQCGNVW